MNALTAIRAYVGGEGLWAKAQKDAVRSLEQYVISSDEADFQSYRRFIQVPLGDMKARIELQKSKPNLDIARDGLLQGRNHPVDIEYMIAFFRRFQHTAYMTRAIGHWAAADRLIAELADRGPHGRRVPRRCVGRRPRDVAVARGSRRGGDPAGRGKPRIHRPWVRLRAGGGVPCRLQARPREVRAVQLRRLTTFSRSSHPPSNLALT